MLFYAPPGARAFLSRRPLTIISKGVWGSAP